MRKSAFHTETLRGFAALALLSALSISSEAANAQSATIQVTATQQQTFQGFGASLTNTIGTFMPSGGRADTAGSVARSLYNILFTPNSPTSLHLAYLRLSVNADLYQNPTITPTTEALSGAIAKTQGNSLPPKANPAYFTDFSSAVVKAGQADVIKAAKSRNPALKIVYCNWTPPYWMKENGADYNANDPITWSQNAKTTNHLLATQKTAYANLLKSFCADYKTYFGYPLEALSFQNEPDVNVPYGSCIYPDSTSVDNKAALYNDTLIAIRTAFGTSAATQLWGPEMTSAKNGDYIANALATKKLNAISVHDYGSNANDFPVSKRGGLSMHQTEYSLDTQYFKINGQVSQPMMAAAMVNQFCKDANDGQVVSWFWWSILGTNNVAGKQTANTGECLMVANQVSNPASVYTFVDQSGLPADHALIALNNNVKYPAAGGPYETPYKQEFGSDWTFTSKYYAFRRLSQSVLPGSISLLTKTTPNYSQSSGAQKDVYAAGFKLPSGKYCVVIANQSVKAYTVTLTVDALASIPYAGVTVYYTSQDGSGKPINDVSWKDVLTSGKATVTVYPTSFFCYVQQ